MRAAIPVLLLLAISAAAQEPAVRKIRPPSVPVEQTFALPGGVSLEIKKDEMTDRRVCTLTTPLFGIYTAFNGSQAALFTSGAFSVDYSAKALARIGDAVPFELQIPHDPDTMLVPKSRTADFVGALYSGERIRVRFNRSPGSYEDNVELANGDFAAGYDFGVELCDWPKATIQHPNFAPEPKITKSPGGTVLAEFGGSHGWLAFFHPGNPRACSARADSPTGELVSVFDRSESVTLLGPAKFYTARASLVATIEPNTEGKTSSGAIIAAAYAAGDDGMVEVFGKRQSLFGFRDAVKFVEQSCGVSWH